MVFYFCLIFSGTNVHKNTYNTIFERYIFTLFKNLLGTDILVILVELWYEMFWNFFVSQSLGRKNDILPLNVRPYMPYNFRKGIPSPIWQF